MQPVTFSQIGLFVACLIVALGIALAVKLLFSRTPPMHREYVSRDEHEKLAKKMDEELGRERGARKKIHEEIGTLQGSIEVVKTQNAHQTTALNDLKSEQGKLRDRVDDVPKRTIELLRNSGALQ